MPPMIGDPELGGFRRITVADLDTPPLEDFLEDVSRRPEEKRKADILRILHRIEVVAGVRQVTPEASMVCTTAGCRQPSNGQRWHCKTERSARKHELKKPGHRAVPIFAYLNGEHS